MIATSFTEPSLAAFARITGAVQRAQGTRVCAPPSRRLSAASALARAEAGGSWPDRGTDHVFKVGLCIPMQGGAGIWGPSCLAAARLAEFELNRVSGIAGRPCELVLVDASVESPDMQANLTELVEAGEVDALVSMCISLVRQRILNAVGGRVPLIYTCLYEGGGAAPGLFAIGETSQQQLQPSIAWLTRNCHPRRWVLIGNDYVWPRVSHAIARRCIAEQGAEVVGEVTVPFGMTDYSEALDQIRRARADAVLISMVGQDAVEFNRAFRRAGLSRDVLRLSCAIEENQLLAIGAANTENLHVALGYFGALETDANLAFKERYHGHFGERAPTLNSIGQSLYEGMHFLSAMLSGTDAAHRAGAGLRHAPMAYPSARGAMYLGAGEALSPMYLAVAEGHLFRVIETL